MLWLIDGYTSSVAIPTSVATKLRTWKQVAALSSAWSSSWPERSRETSSWWWWKHAGAFDFAKECESEQARRLRRAEDYAERLGRLSQPSDVQAIALRTVLTTTIPTLSRAQCVASDDPRLLR